MRTYNFRLIYIFITVFIIFNVYAQSDDSCLATRSLLLNAELDRKVLHRDERIFTKEFIERERSDKRKTVVFDLDETIAFASGDNSLGTPYELRINIEDILKGLKRNNIKIVLWTYAIDTRVRAFFMDQPHLLKYFDLAISASNFNFPNYDELAIAYGNKILKADDFYKTFGEYFSLAKHIACLGYDLIVDDSIERKKEQLLSKKLDIGEYEVVLVNVDMKSLIEVDRIYQKLNIDRRNLNGLLSAEKIMNSA